MTDLAVLSFGAGQDSTALLHLYIRDPEFRARYAPGDFVVVQSDPGNEHNETYEHTRNMRALCDRHGVEFWFLTRDLGFHSDKWPGLVEFYKRTNTCGSKAFRKVCTDKLKLSPIYKWLSQWVAKGYGMPDYGHPYKGKTPLVEFAERYGKIQMLIGIGADEGKRVGGNEDKLPKWQRLSVKKVYPLIDMGMDRAKCQEYLRGIGEIIPLPSNCKICPFLSEQELLWLYRFCPDDYYEWVGIEAAKLKANEHMGNKNLTVWGKKTLPEVLVQAQEKYGHWSESRLMEYKYSHGHCLMSKY